jgi:hypothetical protein
MQKRGKELWKSWTKQNNVRMKESENGGRTEMSRAAVIRVILECIRTAKCNKIPISKCHIGIFYLTTEAAFGNVQTFRFPCNFLETFRLTGFDVIFLKRLDLQVPM